ncbi:MAG: hypothetical protein J0I12_21080 [Candidatus Eremiobacteraeota bacterium]|nr:hypothetical protein [Candidatus Eremiobacteraeota bacterium]
MSIKPFLLGALMLLATMGVAQAQGRALERRHEIRHDLRDNKRDLRDAVRDRDWNRARHEAREVRRDERRLDRNTYHLQRSNNYNRGTYHRYNNFRTYP